MAVATGASGLFVAHTAAAAPPAAPHNIVVFPNRDFVTVEGFQNRVGQTATLEVIRGTQVVGSAQSVVAAGDVAFEVNHPGGACWGAGTDLQVTPDIRAGDKVQIRFGTTVLGDTVVQDAAVQGSAVRTGNTVTVRGYINDGVNAAQVEQRVINPDLKDTSIGRRDIRAVPGGTGDTGYTSSLAIDEAANTFTATYNFTGADAAAVAEAVATGGGERMMSWQVQDAAGNRQGLTIAETGEPGGPGMGGCPAGPADAGAPAGSFQAVKSTTDPTKTAVSWTPAAAVPDAQAVTGYSVVAIEALPADAAPDTPRNQTGVRLGASATNTTLTLDPAKQYDIEVRSIAGPRMSEAFTGGPTAGGGTGGTQDGVGPELTSTPALSETVANAASVTVAGSDDIYYTTDGSDVLTGDVPSATAKVYSGPIAITAANTRVNVVGFDAAGDTSTLTGLVSPAPAAVAAVPTGLTVESVGGAGPDANAPQGQVNLSWTGVRDATDYRIQAWTVTGTGATAVATRAAQYDKIVTTSTAEITNLPKNADGQRYRFRVASRTPNSTAFSANSTPVDAAVPGDTVGIELADYRTGTEFRLGGSGSIVGATITVLRSNTAGTAPTTTVLGTAPVTALAPPEVGGEWELRLSPPPANPGKVFIRSSQGGVAGPFDVTVR
ncbi:chitobiase/beta-hexosaminidase C-terminal domain-containing protein [Geodermatophilus sp. CPCC 206100]|uniref:chitobiase/beta-hexosaminidase C-terminal domain-containing protein n=1 Tax=Geodermatophilus sp. CPCC 206100 TaxID=3020054 RepID=UPI003B00547A